MSTRRSGNWPPGRSFTPNTILLILMTVVLAFTGVVVFTSSSKEVTKWDLSTPQGVVQTYLTSMMDDNVDKAATFLAKESECSLQDLDRAYVPSEIRVYLASTTINNEKASVTVKVDIPMGGPFVEYSTETHTLRLTQTDGIWRLVGTPWPLYDCEVNKK